MKKTLVLMIMILFIVACSDLGDDFDEIEMENGTFYSISYLHRTGDINSNDILNIAYRNNNGVLYNQDGEQLEYEPEDIKPLEPLDSDVLNLIIEDFFSLLMQDSYFEEEDISIDDIEVSVYCGTYNGYIALRFVNNKMLTAVEGSEIVDGLKLIYPYAGGNKVVLWKHNN